MSVRVRDRGYRGLVDRIKRKARAGVTVGIHSEEGSGEYKGKGKGLSIVQVGSFHEFGIGVPRRSFVADWADENRTKHKTQLRKLAQALLKRRLPSAKVALEQFGVRAVGEVQRRIRDGIDPPLEPATIERKGSSTPLIDTGQLRASITYDAKSK